MRILPRTFTDFGFVCVGLLGSGPSYGRAPIPPPTEFVRSIGASEARRFDALLDPIRARKERCRIWSSEWDAVESRLRISSETPPPLTPADRADLRALISKYPPVTGTAYAAWKIYADARKAHDSGALPVLDWMPAYGAYPSCAAARLYTGMKALLAAPDEVASVVKTLIPTLLGESGQEGAEVDFRISLAILERALARKKLNLPAAARNELVAIKSHEASLTKAFRAREGELVNALRKFDFYTPDDPQPREIRTTSGAETYRDLGRETFEYEARIHDGPYSEFKAWLRDWR
jgi:hypothetical protein